MDFFINIEYYLENHYKNIDSNSKVFANFSKQEYYI